MSFFPFLSRSQLLYKITCETYVFFLNRYHVKALQSFTEDEVCPLKAPVCPACPKVKMKKTSVLFYNVPFCRKPTSDFRIFVEIVYLAVSTVFLCCSIKFILLFNFHFLVLISSSIHYYTHENKRGKKIQVHPGCIIITSFLIPWIFVWTQLIVIIVCNLGFFLIGKW